MVRFFPEGGDEAPAAVGFARFDVAVAGFRADGIDAEGDEVLFPGEGVGGLYVGGEVGDGSDKVVRGEDEGCLVGGTGVFEVRHADADRRGGVAHFRFGDDNDAFPEATQFEAVVEDAFQLAVVGHDNDGGFGGDFPGALNGHLEEGPAGAGVKELFGTLADGGGPQAGAGTAGENYDVINHGLASNCAVL